MSEEKDGINITWREAEKAMLEYERTLTAWIRTTISLVSFGFGIYKFLADTDHDRLLTPRTVGLVMISFGLLVLLLAQIQHQRAVRKVRERYPQAQKSISLLLSFLVLVFGSIMFLAALFRQ